MSTKTSADVRSRLKKWSVLAVLGILASTVTPSVETALADTSPPTGQPATVSADALPTVQVDGVVWAQVTVGTTVYATGSFGFARPAGTPTTSALRVARGNLLAYNITTGTLITTFNHSLNGQGRAITVSPDHSRIYVAGEFTTVDGVARGHLVGFTTANGAVVSVPSANLNGNARAVAASNSAVYVGGSFSAAAGNSRSRLAAYSASTGALLSWNPGADATVDSMVMSPDLSRVVVGGSYTTLAGAVRNSMGAVLTDGTSAPWDPSFPIKNASASSSITTLSTDGTKVFGTGYYYMRGGNFEGRFAVDPNTGTLLWMNSCHGDSYAAYPIGTVLYSASHEHDCSDLQQFSQDQSDTFSSTHYYAAAETTSASGILQAPVFGGMYFSFAGQPHSAQLDWYPRLTQGTYTGQSQAAWSVTGSTDYVSYGGEFPTVNGTAQQGLVRFAVRSIAPNAVAPETFAAPIATSQVDGTARIGWRATWDRDNTNLTYSIFRDAGTTAIGSVSYPGAFWDRPSLGFTDSGLTPGSSHTYRIRATDPFGNNRDSATSAAVTIGSASPTSYATMVRHDGALSFWPLGEPAGSIAYDNAGYTDLTLRSDVSRGAVGPIPGDGTATRFSGTSTDTPVAGPPGAPPRTVVTSNSVASSAGTALPLSTFTLEAWVNTSSTTGGIVIGDSLYQPSSPSPDGYQSPTLDRVLYFTDDGKVNFGVSSNNVKQTISSTSAYNDGTWHHLAATIGSGGAGLMVDGTQVADNAALRSNYTFFGHWRLGGDGLNGWTPRPTSGYLAGSIADAAVYPTVLSPATLTAHYQAAGGVPNTPPSASFTASCTDLECSFDASGSGDPDGQVNGYAWSFGDGQSGIGVSPTHTYAATGSYTVTLTVTDNQGGTDSVTDTVSPEGVPPANSAPTASFTTSCTNLSCSVNGSASADPDGQITGYAWDFGDSSVGTGATTSHTYATAGSYPVTLTVTDNDNATGSTQHTVAPTAPTNATFASDTFNRTVSNGFGTATVGGAWTTTTASNHSVVPGTGRIRMPTAGGTQTALLGSTSSSSTDLTSTLAMDKRANGTGGVYVSLIGRRVTTNQEYDAQVRVTPNGAVSVSFLKLNGSSTAATVTAPVTISGLSYTAGNRLNARFQVFGTSPTTLRAKVWANGVTEPAAWTLTATDGSVGIQAAGSVGLKSYLSSSATNVPIVVSVSAFTARPVA